MGLQFPGLKDAVVEVGRFEAEKYMGAVVPELRIVFTTVVVEYPLFTVPYIGLVEIEKSTEAVSNVAVADLSVFRNTVQVVLVPEHAPDQPVNTEP